MGGVMSAAGKNPLIPQVLPNSSDAKGAFTAGTPFVSQKIDPKNNTNKDGTPNTNTTTTIATANANNGANVATAQSGTKKFSADMMTNPHSLQPTSSQATTLLGS